MCSCPRRVTIAIAILTTIKLIITIVLTFITTINHYVHYVGAKYSYDNHTGFAIKNNMSQITNSSCTVFTRSQFDLLTASLGLSNDTQSTFSKANYILIQIFFFSFRAYFFFIVL